MIVVLGDGRVSCARLLLSVGVEVFAKIVVYNEIIRNFIRKKEILQKQLGSCSVQKRLGLLDTC